MANQLNAAISGDFSVDLVLIHIDRVSKFEDQLPKAPRVRQRPGAAQRLLFVADGLMVGG